MNDSSSDILDPFSLQLCTESTPLVPASTTPPPPPPSSEVTPGQFHPIPDYTDDTDLYLADSIERNYHPTSNDIHPHLEKWLPTPVTLTDSNALFQAEHVDGPDNDAFISLLPGESSSQDEELGGVYGSVPSITPSMPFASNLFTTWNNLPISLPPTDAIWAVFFWLCSLVFIYISLGLWLTPAPPTSPTIKIPTSNMLIAIYDAIPVLICTFIVSCLLGAFWVLLMGAFVHVIVWVTILFIPTACVALASWALALLFSYPITSNTIGQASLAQSAFLVLIIITTLVSGIVFSLVTYLQRHHIDLTIRILQLSTHILRQNPCIFLLSFGLLIGSLIYIILWIATITRFISFSSALYTLISSPLSSDPTVQIDSWILGLSWTPTLVFFVFMLVWTTQTIASIHRISLASIVHHWYFSRTTSRLTGTERARRAIIRSSTTLFGTATFGALIASVVQTIRFIHSMYRRYLKIHVHSLMDEHTSTVRSTLGPFVMILSTITTTVYRFMAPLLDLIMRVILVVNHYAMVYAAITGKSYTHSAVASAKLLSRSVSSAAIRDAFAQAVLLLGNAILSGIVGLGIVTVLRTDPSVDSSDSNQVGNDVTSTRAVIVVGMWITWVVMRFWGQVLMHVSDATYLCFAIDVDNKTNHLDLAHSAFQRFRY